MLECAWGRSPGGTDAEAEGHGAWGREGVTLCVTPHPQPGEAPLDLSLRPDRAAPPSARSQVAGAQPPWGGGEPLS